MELVFLQKQDEIITLQIRIFYSPLTERRS